ncbi:MAG: PPC domain-containing protein, partial [Planctomycetia bacterium]
MIPLGRLVEEPQRLTDVLDATTKIAEYSFVADAGDLVSVTVNALSSADLLLAIYADDVAGVPSGKQIAFGDDASASTWDPAITAVLPASGTYRIMVSTRAEFGFVAVASQFRLTASRQASSFTVPAGASGR